MECAPAQVTITPAAPEDVKGIQEVFYRSWLATYPNSEAGITIEDINKHFENAFSEQVLAKRAESIRALPEGDVFLVAKEGAKVVGLCRFMAHPHHNRLGMLYLLPEHQGKGIGKELWDEGVTRLDMRKDVVVDVATYNTRAIRFYEKLGFIDTGKRFTEERHRMPGGTLIPEMQMLRNTSPHPLVALELFRMADEDQSMRRDAQQGALFDTEVDTRNTAHLKEIVAKIGWPTVSKVGVTASHNAWLLVQHADADHAFQKDCLALMQAAPPGEVELRNIAYLEDRIATHENRPQLYGTQFQTNAEGLLEPYPIAERERLEERRAKMGLETFSEYQKWADEDNAKRERKSS